MLLSESLLNLVDIVTFVFELLTMLLNTLLPIFLTLFGIVSCVNFELKNAPSPIVIRLFGNVNVLNYETTNASRPINF